MKKNNQSKKIIVSLALILSFSAIDKVLAQEWQPNSIEKIEASIREDNKKYNEKEYDIRWGDYLYGISQATKVDIDTLAQINSIANKNLIIAGNKLYYGTNSNIVTKDSDGNTRVFQEQRYDGTKKVEEAPKNKLTGKEEKQIVEDNPSLAKDFNSKDKIDKKIVKENKEQIKDLDKDIKDQEKDKKDLQKQKDKLIKDGEEKNKDKIAEIDKKIKETDKKIDSKEKQKEYLQTENDKIEAEKKGDKDKADKKQKELEDKKENDPYEIWKKEQKEKNPDLKDEDLTKEQYEIWKKNKDKKPDVKPEEPKEPEKPADPEKPGKDDPKDLEEKPEEKPNPDKPKDPEDKPEEPKEPEHPKDTSEPEDPDKKVLVLKAFVNGVYIRDIDTYKEKPFYKTFLYPVMDDKEHDHEAYQMAQDYFEAMSVLGNFGDSDYEFLTINEIKEKAKDKDVYVVGEYDDIESLKTEALYKIFNYYNKPSQFQGRIEDKYNKESVEKYKNNIKYLEKLYNDPNVTRKEFFESLLNVEKTVPAPNEVKEGTEGKVWIYPDSWLNGFYGDYIDDEESEEIYRYIAHNTKIKKDDVIIVKDLKNYDTKISNMPKEIKKAYDNEETSSANEKTEKNKKENSNEDASSTNEKTEKNKKENSSEDASSTNEKTEKNKKENSSEDASSTNEKTEKNKIENPNKDTDNKNEINEKLN